MIVREQHAETRRETAFGSESEIAEHERREGAAAWPSPVQSARMWLQSAWMLAGSEP